MHYNGFFSYRVSYYRSHSTVVFFTYICMYVWIYKHLLSLRYLSINTKCMIARNCVCMYVYVYVFLYHNCSKQIYTYTTYIL